MGREVGLNDGWTGLVVGSSPILMGHYLRVLTPALMGLYFGYPEVEGFPFMSVCILWFISLERIFL